MMPLTCLFYATMVLMLPSLLLSQSAYEEASFFHDRVSERLIVLILSRLGMANRLRALADWYSIALMSNRTLLLSWEATPDCNARFTDLFIDGPPGFRVLQEHVPRGNAGVKAVADIASQRNISNRAIYYETEPDVFVDQHKSFILSKDIVFSDKEVIITHYDGMVALEGVDCHQYMMMHSRFLSSLVPNEEAQEFIKSMKKSHFQNRIMVGVHYRAHDEDQDWAVVPPLQGAPKAKYFGTGATVQDFLLAMAKIQAKFMYTDDQGESRSLVRFIITSNNEAAKDQFRQTVHDGIFLSGEHTRNSGNGMQLALVEWLALSESAFILNTYGSSFAVEAAHVHHTPLVGIWDGMLLHHLAMYLPFCGHMQFGKALSSQGVSSTYTEGTHDIRQVEQCSDLHLRFHHCWRGLAVTVSSIAIHTDPSLHHATI